MRIPTKIWKYVGGVGLALVVVAFVVRAWVVPALIVGQIQAKLPGKASIRDWWANGRSAGVAGLTLREGSAGDSPVWASAAKVSTDLSLGRILRGDFAVGRVTLEGPKITLRLDRQGRLLTPLKVKSGGSTSAGAVSIPVVVVKDAEVTIEQEGRPAMVVNGVQGRVAPDADAVAIAAASDDPNWGSLQAHARFDHTFQTGRMELKTTSALAADSAKAAQIPFVPPEVWTHVAPRGDVGVQLTVDLAPKEPVRVQTIVTLLGTAVKSDSLDLTASDATGKVVVEGAHVRLEKIAGRAIDGQVQADGTLDFRAAVPKFDVGLTLTGINVADAPKSWQLHEAGLTGKLSGRADLKVLLDPGGVDLSGSSGEAEVTGGTVEGIPVKSLKLVMHAEGGDLQFDTKKPDASRSEKAHPVVGVALVARPPVFPAIEVTGGRATSATRFFELMLIALQAPAAPPEPAKGKADVKVQHHAAGIKLPRSITTQVELQDVELSQLLSRLQLILGAPIPLPITGKLSLKADATIPLGKTGSIKGYAFHGDLTLAGASIDKVDVGNISARIDLADGVLELKDFRGRLVDRPDGGTRNPPAPAPPVPAQGVLPPGAFRGVLRAEISPPGRLSAQFEGNDLPLGELAAPAFPRPTPVSGLVSFNVEGGADLSAVSQPKSWTVKGKASSVRIMYRGAMLDSFSLGFDLREGRLGVQDLAAKLNGQPLTANAHVQLDAPHRFQGRLDVTGWDLASVVALVPSAPHPSPVAGLLTAHADASGTLAPLKIETKGDGSLAKFQAGPVPLGDVPFRWTTDRDVIVLSGVEARPFGGRLKVEARVPTIAGQATEGSADFTGVDTAKITESMPGQGLKLTGKASGQVAFTIPSDVSRVEAVVKLSAPDLTVQGVPAERVHVSVRAHKGKLSYVATAESLGGKIKFEGDFPLAAAAKSEAGGELRAAGFTLAEVWKALGVTGAATHLEGEGAIDANLRAGRVGPDSGLWAHGFAAFRKLSWGKHYPLGDLRGTVALTPTHWRVEPLAGDLLGGVAVGSVWGTTSDQGQRQVGFDLQVDRASLKRVLAILPAVAKNIDGFGTLRLAGRLEESFRATAEFDVGRARFFGFPLTEMKAPAVVIVTPGTGNGVLHVRRFSARFAGGQIRGDASFRIGEDRTFSSAVALTDVDLESILRFESDARRPASGRISGRVALGGPSPALPARYRGKVSLDLTDASLVSIPVFRAIDKFLGGARGGLFEDGDLTATIANNHLIVEQLTLVGRLAQLHAVGTVGFDGQLNLEVVINTNQIIAETGQALVARIPGLNQVLGRSEQAMLKVANYFSNRLLKLRVSGTLRNPQVAADPSIVVGDGAVSFFVGVLKLPLGFLK